MSDFNENMPSSDESTQAHGIDPVTKLKEYGKKAYGPLLGVVTKYQDEFTPYLNAVTKGLQGGVNSLNQDTATEAEKYVSQLFEEAVKYYKIACEKLESKDVDGLTTFLAEQAHKRPGVMFGASYVAGLLFGRIGTHLVPKPDASSNETINSEPPSIDEAIH